MNHNNYQTFEKNEVHINSIKKSKLNKQNITPEKSVQKCSIIFKFLINNIR